MKTIVHRQSSVEEAFNCLTQKILQAAKKTISKTLGGTKWKPLVVWWENKREKERHTVRVAHVNINRTSTIQK